MPPKKDIQVSDNHYSEPRPLDSWTGSIYDHASKLVTATYLVTGLFPNEEPLKGHLRRKSLDILSGVVSFFKNRGASESWLKIQIEETMSLIHMGAVARIISPMNKNVLLDEYRRFLERITAQSGSIVKNISRDIGDMLASVPNVVPQEEVLAPVFEYKGQERDKGHFKKTQNTKTASKRQPRSDNNGRKDKILSVIKQKGEVTIKDIAGVIEGVSEKTVQRDLIDLLGAGTIKKRGERRWTVYSIA